MHKEAILNLLRAHRMELRRMGVESLALFGSYARDENRTDSDVDLLVEFHRPIGLFAFIQVQQQLETILGRRVDLVTHDAVRPTMREQIFREAINV